MSSNDQPGELRFVSNVLPVVEFDMSGGEVIDPSQYGLLEFVSNVLPVVELDFAVPDLVLILRPAGESTDPNLLALDAYNLMIALSDYDAATGGRGMRLHGRSADTDSVTLTLAPIMVEGATDRLNALVSQLRELTQTASRPEGTLIEAFNRAVESPMDRLRLELSRRPWQLDYYIEPIRKAG